MSKRGAERVGRVPDGWRSERDASTLEIDADADPRFRVTLDQMIPGAAGEIVLFNDSALREVVVVAPTAPTDEGTVDDHVTAEGVDVGGFRFLRFDGDQGVVLYHDPDTAVTVDVD